MAHSKPRLSWWPVVGSGFIGILIWLALRSSAAAPGPSGAIPATFFGLQMHKPLVADGQPWPTVPFGAGRLWDSGVSWAEVNKSQGAYDWET